MNTRQPTPTTTRILAQRRNFKPRLTAEILRQPLQLMLLTPCRLLKLLLHPMTGPP